MLGEQIAELKGKVMGQRVMDAEGPTMETTLSQTGNVKGIQVNETVTYVGRPTSSGVLHAEGNGVIMAAEAEIAIFTAEAFGRVSSSGSLGWRGSHFYRTSSTGKLAFLNNVVGIFEAGIGTDGNSSKMVWEWPDLLNQQLSKAISDNVSTQKNETKVARRSPI